MYLIYYFFLKILVVFKIVSKVTPVSAKTACHILAIPISFSLSFPISFSLLFLAKYLHILIYERYPTLNFCCLAI